MTIPNRFPLLRKYLALATVLICIGSAFASPQKTKKPVNVNIPAVCDSALLMADEYAKTLQSDPEFGSVRMNVLKNYYNAIPSKAAQDSVRQRIFDFYVNYVEQSRPERAKAFRDCYTAIAPENDENRGALLAADLAQARIDMDTTSVRNLIIQLESFSARNNLDYDADLTEARAWLHEIETRKPIKDILSGVWVSDKIAEYNENAGNWGDGYSDENFLPASFFILKIRDTSAPIYRELYKKAPFVVSLDSVNSVKIKDGDSVNLNLDAIKSRGATRPGGTPAFYGFKGISPIWPFEYEAYNIQPVYDSLPKDIDGDGNMLEVSSHSHSKTMITDDKAYGAYIFWGDERLKRGDPEIAAIGRQNVQAIQASVAGVLSRSNHSTSEAIAGNILTGLASAGINAGIDALMVSKEKIWSAEVFLQMINPYKLKATIICQLITSSSNSSEVKKVDKVMECYYYRWEPQDNVVFMSPASMFHNEGIYKMPLLLSYITKSQKKMYESEMKDFYKSKRKEVEAELNSIKKTINEMPKGIEKDIAKKKFEDEIIYKVNQKPMIDWNTLRLAKLKAKADNYKRE